MKHGIAIAPALLLIGILACSIDIPGGEFPPTTPTPEGPTATPVILGMPTAAVTVPISIPPPTPTQRPATPTPAGEPASGSSSEKPAMPQAEMVKVPGGTFTMGYNKGQDDEKPEHQVDVPDFELDIFEVTNAQFDAFVKATGYQTDPEKKGNSKTWKTEWGEGEDNHPVVRVSWNDANAFCQAAGKRLPTEAEWEKAARGPEDFLYPWGNEFDVNKANGRESNIRTTVAVGSYGEGQSPYGVYDMAGNVREWTADFYKPYPGNTKDSPYYGEKFRVLRGGGWFDDAPELRSTRRNANVPDAANWDIGFRCVR